MLEATKAFFNHALCFCLHIFSGLEGIKNEEYKKKKREHCTI
jgi:hypothetical protein